MKKLLKESLNDSDTTKEIFTGAMWTDGNDYMRLEVRPSSVYGCGDDFDFSRETKEEALAQLKKWGYHYIGAE